MLEDHVLIWKFKGGSREALCRIYQKYKKDLLRLATILLNNAGDAEDVVHDVFLTFLCREGEFSLDTLTSSLPAGVRGITPVKAADTAASRETVLFEAKHESTPERLTIWALRRSKLPIRVNFSDPRKNEYGDFFFDYSERKDPSFFDPAAFAKQ